LSFGQQAFNRLFEAAPLDHARHHTTQILKTRPRLIILQLQVSRLSDFRLHMPVSLTARHQKWLLLSQTSRHLLQHIEAELENSLTAFCSCVRVSVVTRFQAKVFKSYITTQCLPMTETTGLAEGMTLSETRPEIGSSVEAVA
jgi:hypothetical protein